MIPLRIGIEGFLCYRARQEIDLTDLGLCMLSGPNGSGKSTVFDAVTFALFGAHRAGEQRYEELINKRCDRAIVEFDFRLGGDQYRAYRTVKRKTKGGSQTTAELREWSAGDGQWLVVPETTSARGFERWIGENLGLGYETFGCSMLLRQGHADRLLLAGPKDRFQVLAGVMDLQRYQRLAQRADDRRRAAEASADALAAQVRGLPEVTAQQVDEAAGRSQLAAAAVAEAEAAVGRLQALREQAARWEQLGSKAAEARRQREAFSQLLARADQVEPEWLRLCELRTVVPVLKQLAGQQAKLDASVAAEAEAKGKLDAAQKEAAQSAAQVASVQAEIQVTQTKIDEADRQEREAAGSIARAEVTLCLARGYAQQKRELEEVRSQLRKFDADPVAAAEVARKEYDRLAALLAALPALRRVAESRAAGARAAEKLLATREQLERTERDLAGAVQDRETLAPQLLSAESALKASEQRDHEAATLAKVAEAHLVELDQIHAAAECPTCGQPLTDEHRHFERERRQAQARERHQQLDHHSAARRAAAERVREFKEKIAALDERKNTLAARVQELRATARQLEKDRDRAAKELDRTTHELPEAFRQRVGAAHAEWPSEPDFDQIAREAESVAAAKQAAAAADEALGRWQRLNTTAQTIERSLADCPRDLPPLATLEDEHRGLTQLRERVRTGLAEARAHLGRRQKEFTAASERSAQVSKQCEALDRQLAQLAVAQDHLREAIDRLTSDLAEPWRQSAAAKRVPELEQELAALESADVQSARERLHQARAESAALDQRLCEIRCEIETIPTDARRPLREIGQELAEAEQRKRLRQQEHLAAERERVKLAADLERVESLRRQFRAADRDRHRYKQLAQLLGRDGLQRELVRRAERGIVECANSILDRLSGGDLSLQLRETEGDAADHALELEAVHRRMGLDCPIDVAFLSGSQRFRVAVALALAIGRYASGGSRVGESVIIDEGFGSLDSEGQQVMIEELRRLKGIMQCIVLVSHQESFADAFSQGYRFVLEDGETRVSRIG